MLAEHCGESYHHQVKEKMSQMLESYLEQVTGMVTRNVDKVQNYMPRKKGTRCEYHDAPFLLIRAYNEYLMMHPNKQERHIVIFTPCGCYKLLPGFI